MRAYEIIQKKREGISLSQSEIHALVDGFTKGEVADYQMAAFAMAVFFRGMTGEELASFTEAMLHSGMVVDLSHIPKIKVDKHSTGGVGDKVSLPLAPAVAACGVPVPMVSGRGLGHTGGTLDKLESIPGFRVDLDVERYRQQVEAIGCALIGQTDEVAPADKKLYALRDVTATVDCIPLIASSILSKKLAEGIDALVLDVKFGSGAFMREKKDARILAKTMVDIGTRMGKTVVARLTSMEQPLGRWVGNALEVRESIEILNGEGPEDLVELVEVLGAEMLCMGKVAQDLNEGRKELRKVLQNGAAKECFKRIVEAQGGDVRSIEDPDRLPTTTKKVEIQSPNEGYVQAINTEQIGVASLVLGGGRRKTTDAIDPKVGIEVCARLGQHVHKGDPLCILHVSEQGIEEATQRILDAYKISPGVFEPPLLIVERITADDEELGS